MHRIGDVNLGHPAPPRHQQAALADLYGKIDELFPNDRIVHIDAHQSVEGVAEAIWTEVMKLRGESV